MYRRQLGLLCRRAHLCSPNTALVSDLVERDLSQLGMRVLAMPEDEDGHVDVIVTGCPGVRLRALAEAAAHAKHPLPPAVVWHVVARSAALRAVWSRARVKPGDTFVGFDGSMHFFPCMEASFRSEAPSFVGDEVFDTLVVDDDAHSLTQLMCGTLPPPVLHWSLLLAHRQAGLSDSAPPQPPPPPEVCELMAGPRCDRDASEQLGELTRHLFPEAYRRHQRVYQELEIDPAYEGRRREAAILAL